MTTLYEKRGRRYVPVQDTEAFNGLRNGCWTVVVQDGMTSVRKCVDPDFAALQAAMELMERKMVTAMSNALRAQPETRPLTETERRAWQAFCEVMEADEMTMRLMRCSAWEAVQAGVAVLEQELLKRRTVA